MREVYLERIRLLESQLILLLCTGTGIGWLLLPLLAIGLGFARQSERLFQLRSVRSPKNAP